MNNTSDDDCDTIDDSDNDDMLADDRIGWKKENDEVLGIIEMIQKRIPIQVVVVVFVVKLFCCIEQKEYIVVFCMFVCLFVE